MLPTLQAALEKQPIVKAWLFGSYSRGEETEDSDVDILVHYKDDSDVSLFIIGGMYLDLRRITGRNVDLIEEGTLEPYAAKTGNRDKILIYERP
jgi:predicted nucleotidyltransferase